MLDPIEEEKIKKLKEMGRELKIPPLPEIFINMEVHDPDGNLTYKDKQRAHSWLRNMWDWQCWGLFYYNTFSYSSYVEGVLGIKKLNGDLSPPNFSSYGIPIPYYRVQMGTYPYGSVTLDVYVGTSDTAWTNTQYTLGSVIANGDSSGQLRYSTGVMQTPVYTAGTKLWTCLNYKVFNNNSGGTIVVKETGLRKYASYTSGSIEFMAERSVLSPTVSVVNGAQLTVTYELQMDWSSVE